ncbi:MAG: hypothetical protein GY832_03965 [Chloroflexi bacterium]|nr:hypothetical protein [Chloroflexota bacterium]
MEMLRALFGKYRQPSEHEKLLKSAFPSSIEKEVDNVISKLTWGARLRPSGSFRVMVEGESLEIPSRGYWAKTNLQVVRNFPSLEAEIARCLYTRHHDGYVRERCLRDIIVSNNSWIPAYVTRLLGEYVVEILLVIEQHLDKIDPGVYKGFLSANPEFYEKTKHRVISYWNCYYRQQWPRRDDYVGFRIIQAFDSML